MFQLKFKLSKIRSNCALRCQSKSSYHSMDESYRRAISALKCLQSNQQVLADPSSCQFAESKIAKVGNFFSKCGLDVELVEKKLPVIHVAGTKGKGSTCAFCESILRHHGYKTGFYSSPHLVSVRETMRVNGQPLDRQKFSDYFWQVYQKLCTHNNYKDTPEMPPYFTFLTIMAFKVFIEEKVDVAIIEVGIGGEYDCTNVLKNTPIIGITSIDYDHVKLLGNTLEEIAWQKAGIMKRNCIAITLSSQPPAAVKILNEKTVERNCTLFLASNMESYFTENKVSLGICSSAQYLNASLAIQLANAWLNPQLYKKDSIISLAPIFPLTNEFCLGLNNCYWPGRTQILYYSEKLNFYLDGAHTCDSMKNCVSWYIDNVPKQSIKVLVFNVTGNRDYESLIDILIRCNFHYVFFSPNAVDSQKTLDLENAQQHENEEELERSKHYYSSWIKKDLDRKSCARLFKNVNEIFDHLKDTVQYDNLHILVAGSLHLVGAFLTLIDPDLSCRDKNYKTKTKNQ